MTAICLCAAAGLQLGTAIATPGRRGRAAPLREAVPAALVLFAAALPLLAAAALIESFVRESTLGIAARLAVAAACLLATLAVLIATRRSAPARVDTAWLREAGRGGAVCCPLVGAPPSLQSPTGPGVRRRASGASSTPGGAGVRAIHLRASLLGCGILVIPVRC